MVKLMLIVGSSIAMVANASDFHYLQWYRQYQILPDRQGTNIPASTRETFRLPIPSKRAILLF